MINTRLIKERFLKEPNIVLDEIINLINKQEEKINKLNNVIKEEKKEINSLMDQLKAKDEEVKFLKNKLQTIVEPDNYYKKSKEKTDYSQVINDKKNMSILDLMVLNISRYNKTAEKIMEDILVDVIAIDDNLDKSKAYNLLFSSVVLGKDTEIVEKFSSVKQHLEEKSNEQKIYSLYTEARRTLEKDKIKELSNIIQNEGFTYIDKTIESRVTSAIKSNLDNLQHISSNTYGYYIDKKKDDKYNIFKEYKLINFDNKECVNHGVTLIDKSICLIQYSDNKYTFIKNMINTNGYVCPICNRLYLDREQLKEIETVYGLNGLKMSNEN